MGYKLIKMGSLYLDGQLQCIPKKPTDYGDIPAYGGSSICIRDTIDSKAITWVKPNNMNLLVADRVLVKAINWANLDSLGFVAGEEVVIDGRAYLCRLLRVGAEDSVPNEWDIFLDVVGEDDSLLHWKDIFFWGQEMSKEHPIRSTVRGYVNARFWTDFKYGTEMVSVGFRPVLELSLPNTPPSGERVCLDGQNFILAQAAWAGKDSFHPVLYPTNQSYDATNAGVFNGISSETAIRMYTLLLDGKPVCPGSDILQHIEGTKFSLTDEYFGDEYLIPWTISNGVAVAQSLIV